MSLRGRAYIKSEATVVGLTLPVELLEKVDEMAKERGMSRSATLHQIVKEYFNE